MIIIINKCIDFRLEEYYDIEKQTIIILNDKRGEIRMPLTMVALGETKTISEFKGKEDIKKHLLNLGFIKGEKVEVVGDNASGIILMIKGVKIALNKGLASKIMVD
ncbi:MAG: Fe2+ transport system protein [Herbinix sp.]|jgi:ferrous iron transport protein A|nr:Fe2+ transport system protein [Herbinix sp.]